MLKELWLAQMLRRFIAKSEFTRNAITLMTGTTIAQVVSVVISPVLSRIYSPKDFGVFALYLGIVGLCAPIITGAYERAIVLPKENEEAAQVAVLSTLLTLVGSSVALVVIVFFNRSISNLLKNQGISTWLYFIPLSMFLAGLYQILNYWAMRRKQYRRMATSRVVQSTTAGTSNLGMGLGGFGAGGLVLGGIIGEGVAVCMLGHLTPKENNIQKEYISMEKLIRQAREYQNFPRYNLPQTFFDGLRESGFIFLMSYFFDPTALGFYALALRVLKAPLNLIGTAVSQVFYQMGSQRYNSGQKLWPLLKTVLTRLIIIALVGSTILIIFGPAIFSAIFGKQWKEAGKYAQILSPWLMVNLISSPVSQIPLILGKQKAFFFIGMGYNALILGVFLVAATITRNVDQVLNWISILASLYLVCVIYWFATLSREEIHKK